MIPLQVNVCGMASIPGRLHATEWISEIELNAFFNKVL